MHSSWPNDAGRMKNTSWVGESDGIYDACSTSGLRPIQIFRYDNVHSLKKSLNPVQLDDHKAFGLPEDIFTSSQPPSPSETSTG